MIAIKEIFLIAVFSQRFPSFRWLLSSDMFLSSTQILHYWMLLFHVMLVDEIIFNFYYAWNVVVVHPIDRPFEWNLIQMLFRMYLSFTWKSVRCAMFIIKQLVCFRNIHHESANRTFHKHKHSFTISITSIKSYMQSAPKFCSTAQVHFTLINF